MLDRMIRQSDLFAMLRELAKKSRIVGPVRHRDRFLYEEVADVDKLDLEFNYCVYAPRAWLFPPKETLFTFEATNGSFATQSVYDPRPLALVGVHPCDLHAIRLLDHVFESDVRDEHYLTRRRNTFLVGIDCATPCTGGVFCGDMHTNGIDKGFDVMLYPLGKDSHAHPRYGAVFGTAAGRQWVLYSRRSSVPSVEDERALDAYLKEKETAFVPQLKTHVENIPALLDRSYDSLLWEATARRCYSCGSCNLSCPTCYCFNIQDEASVDGQSGKRVREWDGCQLKSFAEVAGGHNFRSRAASRLRHRIYRKAKWIQDRTGLAGCVGCARCDRACTAKINSVEIYNQLTEEEV